MTASGAVPAAPDASAQGPTIGTSQADLAYALARSCGHTDADARALADEWAAALEARI